MRHLILHLCVVLLAHAWTGGRVALPRHPLSGYYGRVVVLP